MPAASKYDIKPCTPLTSTVTTFCAAKDQWGRFNLDSYLVPKGINCPIPKTINVCINAGLEYANTGASVSCRVGEKYYNYDQTIAALYLPPASAVKVKVPQKQLKYPKGSVSLDYSQGGVLFPETDPVVTITRLSLTKPNPATSNPAFDQQYRYQLKVSFAACEVPIAGRSVAEVCTCPSGYTLRQPTNRGDLPYCTQGTLNATASCEPLGQYTKGVNWPSPCPTSQLHNIDYTGVINVDSAPFQEVIQAPIVATPTVCGDVNLPFQGSFLGLLSGQKVDGGNFAQGLQFTLTQSGTSVSGSAVGTGTSLDGTFSGTLPTPTSRTLSNVSVSFTGACTGTILGNNVTISSTGCRLTGSFSGALTSTVTGADCPNISNSTLDAMKSSSP
ncbi:MAG: hypothetical protein EB078_10970 [Proteobacteria bacterium]|nr:hypothetical protein [Pseudomonadota bacterium]NDD05419.1 hypothetical protein [Pseudomonadota bacterium]